MIALHQLVPTCGFTKGHVEILREMDVIPSPLADYLPLTWISQLHQSSLRRGLVKHIRSSFRIGLLLKIPAFMRIYAIYTEASLGHFQNLLAQSCCPCSADQSCCSTTISSFLAEYTGITTTAVRQAMGESHGNGKGTRSFGEGVLREVAIQCTIGLVSTEIEYFRCSTAPRFR